MCEDSTLPTIAQSVFFAGAVFGGLIFGWIADRYGRIPSLVGSNVVAGLAGIATAFSYNFFTFTVCRFIGITLQRSQAFF